MKTTRLALVGSLSACAALAACTPEGVLDDRPRADVGTVGRWTVTVSVEPEHIGPVTISVDAIRRSKPSEVRQWLEHDIVFANTSDRRVSFADTRTTQFIGPSGHRRKLLAADEGCGNEPAMRDSRLETGCLLYLDAFVVKQGASVSRTVGLFKGLREMEPLTAGRSCSGK